MQALKIIAQNIISKKMTNEKLFLIGLLLKIIFSIFYASSFLDNFFVPFINYYVNNNFNNPYQEFISKGIFNAFPYPSLMLFIVSLPKMLLGSLFDIRSIFFIRIPILLADIAIFTILLKIIKNNNKKIVIYYWLSPVLIYINYIHGQLDAIPISIFFISLYLLFKKKFEYSSIFFGMSIATKTNMLMVLPFYVVYLFYNKNLSFKRLVLNILIIIFTFFIINYKYIFDKYFIEMVFNNHEQFKIFDFSYNFQNGNTLYFTIFSYVLLLVIFINLKSISKDVYVMFLGFIFGIITLMISPMQGWYYWILPFFIYFNCKEMNNNNKLMKTLFFTLQLSYFLYFLFVIDSDYLQALKIADLPNLYHFLQNNNVNADIISNIFFTILQTILFANCLFIYKSGILKYLDHKLFSDRFLLGICGDSGAGKSTIANAIESIFQKENTTIIHGDDMHKWERGNENWNKLTHLNPKSNFLHNEISQLKAIKNGESIIRRHYNHDNGRFTKEKKFKPNNLVIFEGLHSFYIKPMRDLYDLKIFVKPSEELRKNWKVSRDTVKRGYSENKILKQIDDRKEDSQKFIDSQMKYADIIIEIISNQKIEDTFSKNDQTLKITATNSFYLEPVYNELCKIKSIKCIHEYEDEDRQILLINGDISSLEIDLCIRHLSLYKELTDLEIDNYFWYDNYLGIIQLFITYCVIKNILI
jgi:uridine kinase